MPLTKAVAGLGMELESVTLKLPRDLLSGAQRVATARDVTIGHMVRQLLKREVDRQLSEGQQRGTDGRLLAALSALLSRDMADARDWDDLAGRLRPHGYELRPAGGGVVLYKSSCGTRVCQGSDLGFGYGDLVKRFGGPMPARPEGNACAGAMPAGHIDPTRQAMLSAHLDAAHSWPDLVNRLAVAGLELRPLGAGLGIYKAATGRHLCNTSTLGASYKTLIKRFGAEIGSGLPADSGGNDDAELVQRG